MAPPPTVQRRCPWSARQWVAALSLGYYYGCAPLVAGGAVLGLNDRGQLGNGGGAGESGSSGRDRLATGVTAIAAGYIMCAIITGGAVKCWGWNAYGNPVMAATATDRRRWRSATVQGCSHQRRRRAQLCVADSRRRQALGATTSSVSRRCQYVQSDGTGQCFVAHHWRVRRRCWRQPFCAVTQGGRRRVGVPTPTVRSATAALRTGLGNPVTGFDSGVAAVSTGAHHSCALTSSVVSGAGPQQRRSAWQ